MSDRRIRRLFGSAEIDGELSSAASNLFSADGSFSKILRISRIIPLIPRDRRNSSEERGSRFASSGYTASRRRRKSAYAGSAYIWNATTGNVGDGKFSAVVRNVQSRKTFSGTVGSGYGVEAAAGSLKKGDWGDSPENLDPPAGRSTPVRQGDPFAPQVFAQHHVAGVPHRRGERAILAFLPGILEKEIERDDRGAALR